MRLAEISQFEITGVFIADCVHVSYGIFEYQSFSILLHYPDVVDTLLELAALLTRILKATRVLGAAMHTSRLDSLGWPIQILGGIGKGIHLH